MKKAAKKAVKKVQAKTAPKKKAKAPVKAATKKAAPKKKTPPSKAKVTAKKAPAAKAKAVLKSKPVAKKVSPTKPKPLAKPKPPTPLPVRAAAPPAPASPPPAPILSSSGKGTAESPWLLKTPAGFSEFQAYREENSDPPMLVVKVGSTELKYHLRCLNDLHQMLKAYGDWMQLGSADEQQPVMEGTVESWARSPSNPIGGFYGLKAGLRGRFATYVPQVMEVLGLAEVEHFPNNNRMRAK